MRKAHQVATCFSSRCVGAGFRRIADETTFKIPGSPELFIRLLPNLAPKTPGLDVYRPLRVGATQTKGAHLVSYRRIHCRRGMEVIVDAFPLPSPTMGSDSLPSIRSPAHRLGVKCCVGVMESIPSTCRGCHRQTYERTVLTTKSKGCMT